MAQDLNKVYNNNIKNHVIKDINLTFEKGEYIVITGKSGSGKTTLLYLLSGLEVPTSGKVLFHDISLGDLKDKEISYLRRSKFGFIFQFYNLVKNLNVRDNIFLPIEYSKKKMRD